MSQRAAWQFEQLGFTNVYDFVVGKAHWLASGRPTVRSEPIDRVSDHLVTDVAMVDITADVAEALRALSDNGGDRVIVVNSQQIVLGVARQAALKAVTAETAITDLMRVGPTTIRPDENTAGVQKRMTGRKVPALIVTATTGRFLGLFVYPDGTA